MTLEQRQVKAQSILERWQQEGARMRKVDWMWQAVVVVEVGVIVWLVRFW